MARKFPSRWPSPVPVNGLMVVEPAALVKLLAQFSAKEPVFYLHPSSGYYFEWFLDRPQGLIHRLVPRGQATEIGEKFGQQLVAMNERFWQQCWTETLEPLVEQIKPQPDSTMQPRGKFAAIAHLQTEENQTAKFLAGSYANSLDYWGVCIQRLGRWPEAGTCFARALNLRRESVSARINWEYNQQRQRGESRRLDIELFASHFPALFDKYRNWQAVLYNDGPIDEPNLLFEFGRTLFAAGDYRQAVIELTRCTELDPSWLEPKLWLVDSQLAAGDFPGVLSLADDIASGTTKPDAAGEARLLVARAIALSGLGQTNEAAETLQRFLERRGQEPQTVSLAAQLFLEQNRPESALALLNPSLSHSPDNPELLLQKGIAELRLQRPQPAIQTLTAALLLQPTNEIILLNRAIAQLRTGELEAAQMDYAEVLKLSPNSAKGWLGLGEIAVRKTDTNTAIKFYSQCLSNSTPGSTDYRLATGRLRELKANAKPREKASPANH